MSLIVKYSVMYCVVLCSAVVCCIAPFSEEHRNSVPCSEVLSREVQDSEEPCGSVLCSEVKSSAVPCGEVLYHEVPCS